MKEGKIEVVHCSTNDQVADILTKGLLVYKHECFREELGVKSFEQGKCVGKGFSAFDH